MAGAVIAFTVVLAAELTNEVTLPEAESMRFARQDKDYVGVGAIRASAREPHPWICACTASLRPCEDGISAVAE